MRSRPCCPVYCYGLMLFPNSEQVTEQDEVEVIIPIGSIYAPSQVVADCIALELSEADLREELCELGPTAEPQSLQTPFETNLAIFLTGSDPLGSTLIYTLETSPANGVILGEGQNLTYVPNAGFSGSDSFDFSVNNGFSSDTATISIEVLSAPYFWTSFIGDQDTPSEAGCCPLSGNPEKLFLNRTQCLRVYYYQGCTLSMGTVVYPPSRKAYRLRRWNNSPLGSGNPAGNHVFEGPDSQQFFFHEEVPNTLAWSPSSLDTSALHDSVEAESPGLTDPFDAIFVVAYKNNECVEYSGEYGTMNLVAFLNGWLSVLAIPEPTRSQAMATYFATRAGREFVVESGPGVEVTELIFGYPGPYVYGPPDVVQKMLEYCYLNMEQASRWYFRFTEATVQARFMCPDPAFDVFGMATNFPQSI